MSEKGLVWSPVKAFIKCQIEKSESLLTIIAPFIQLNALTELLSVAQDLKDLNIITRWRAEDIISGVSDIEIYPYLKEKGIKLFYHERIHLKLYVFNSNSAFSSSANITNKGLGDTTTDYNVEIGALVEITDQDWLQIHRLLLESIQVTDTVYEVAKNYVNDNKRILPPLPKLIFVDPNAKPFSLKSLPKTESPAQLYDFYENNKSKSFDKEFIKRGIHDLILYKVNDGLTKEEFYKTLSNNFLNQDFIKAVIQFIKTKCEERKNERKNGVRFGEMTQWLQENCSDSPMPFRSEIKTDTRMLYNWLQHFKPEVSWSQPNHSQVIVWEF